MSDGANKRAVLEALGVDVWVTRRRPDSAQAGSSKQQAAATVVASGSSAALEKLSTPRAESEPVQPDPPTPIPAMTTQSPLPSADEGPPKPAMDALPVAPFTVFSLTKGQALILCEPTDAKAGRRFAVDVISAASGIWGGSVAQLAFEWPQPGIANDEHSVARALGAFVDKQVSDHGDGIRLIGGELVRRLSEPPEGCVILPPIDALMTEGDLKRALWIELESRPR